MTPEQLQKTRAERWRQNGNALLTLEDAEEWLRPLGLCLFLPRRVQLATPAPSFVEACLGQTNATPSLAAIQDASALLTRLVDKGSVIPLNLLGISGEQPDFLVTPEALPYVFALRGDKDWKHEPATAGNGRVSPLVHGIWKALERTGVQTAVELRESMGKELTEAAVLRGLSELWNAMRVIMLPGEPGEGATWELLKARYQKQMAAGAAMSQVSALSVLLAQYLESAVGATSEEAEIFLSPLSSRSKVREVVRGLTATRQLAMIGLDGQAVLYVEGTLPEFEQPESQVTIEAITAEPEPAADDAATPIKKIKKFTKRATLAPGEPDPLRWKRDSSVPPPAGQSRGPRPDSEGFDRRSKPARPARPAAGRSAARTGNLTDGPNFGVARPVNPSGERPRTSRPGTERKTKRPTERPSERWGGHSTDRPSPPFSKPGFAARGERPSTSRAASSRPAARDSRGFDKKPRWAPREAGAATDRPRRASSGTDRPYSTRPNSTRPNSTRPNSTRPNSTRPKTGFSPSGRPPATGGSRPYSRPAAGGFKSRTDRPSPSRSTANRPDTGPSYSPRPRPSGPGSFEKKPRWIPREGSGATGRPPAGRSASSSQSSSRSQAPGGSGSFSKPRFGKPGFGKPGFGKPGFKKAGTGGFKPGTDASSASRPFSPRPTSSRPASTRPASTRPAASGSFEKKPRWVPREGSDQVRPGTGRASGSRSTGDRPAKSFGDKPSFGTKSGFGMRPSSGTGRTSSSGRSSGSRSSSGRSSGSRSSGGGPGARPSGKPGFGRKPGGRPSFGKRSNPGDFPKRKRPE